MVTKRESRPVCPKCGGKVNKYGRRGEAQRYRCVAPDCGAYLTIRLSPASPGRPRQNADGYDRRRAWKRRQIRQEIEQQETFVCIAGRSSEGVKFWTDERIYQSDIKKALRFKNRRAGGMYMAKMRSSEKRCCGLIEVNASTWEYRWL